MDILIFIAIFLLLLCSGGIAGGGRTKPSPKTPKPDVSPPAQGMLKK